MIQELSAMEIAEMEGRVGTPWRSLPPKGWRSLELEKDGTA